MARRFDPVLKQWIDEPDAPGALPDPTAMPGVAAPELRADPAGAVPNVAVNFPQKPLAEVETEATRRTAAPRTVQAESDLVAAQGATDAASTRVGEVEGNEALVHKQYADEASAEKARQLEQVKQDEAARQQLVQSHQAADDKEIEQERNARLDAGKARATYWEGRPGAEVFTRLLQVIGGVAHDLSGRAGPSPVDQVLEANISAHEKRLVGAWEATKEANALRRTNRAAYMTELDRQRIAAANQSLLSLDLIGEQLNAAIAGLSKEKQQAARQAADASLNEQRAQVRLGRQQIYDVMSKRSETQRTLGEGAGAPPLANREDVEAVAKLEQAAKEREDLAAQIEGNGEAWTNYQGAAGRQANEDAEKEIPFVGKAGVAIGRVIEGHDVGQKLINIGDKTAATIARGLQKINTSTAKDYGGAITDSDIQAAREELGVQTQNHTEIAATLRRQAQQMREKASGVRSQRTFVQRPGGSRKDPTPADPAVLSSWSEERLRTAVAETYRRKGADPNAAAAWADFSRELARRGAQK